MNLPSPWGLEECGVWKAALPAQPGSGSVGIWPYRTRLPELGIFGSSSGGCIKLQKLTQRKGAWKGEPERG